MKDYRCEPGFNKWIGSTCRDIDECASKIKYCGDLDCTNTEGSFVCGCRYGFRTLNGGCIDINECDRKGICPESATCENGAGNYTCACKPGYTGNLCADIDECSDDFSNCDVNANCKNIVGSFICTCNEGFYGNGKTCSKGQCNDAVCPENAECISPTTPNCKCKSGFSVNNSTDCVDINECLAVNDCGENATCGNSIGSYSCECDTGFYGSGKVCIEGLCDENLCPPNEVCKTPNSFCDCKDGLERDSNGVCTDIDECLSKQVKCGEHAKCINTFGSFNCLCNEDFYGNGQHCSSGQCSDSLCPDGGITMQCVSPRSVECECRNGFAYNETNNCADINECELSNSCGINEICRNMFGTYQCDCAKGSSRLEGTTETCSCESGYEADDIGKCVDIDECPSGNLCHEKATCYNTASAYTCKCNDGFFGDGFECDNQRVLVLNSYNGWQPGVLISTSGEHQTLGCLKVDPGASSAWASCSVSWKNKMHIFGGAKSENMARQISRLDGEYLANIGSLSFDLQLGACSTMGETIYLCFNSLFEYEKKGCHVFQKSY